MTLKPCTSEYMLSTVDGVGMARGWFPRIVAEAFLGSTKDGEVKQAPDPVTMIDGDISWTNNSADPLMVFVQVMRAPRTVVVQSPSTVVIHDAWSWATGESPTADYPSVVQDTFGGKLQIDRPATAAKDLKYGRQFFDTDSNSVWVTIGEIRPQRSLHFRYLAAVQTPGCWTSPTEFEPRWEANARWTRLYVFTTPVGAR